MCDGRGELESVVFIWEVFIHIERHLRICEVSKTSVEQLQVHSTNYQSLRKFS